LSATKYRRKDLRRRRRDRRHRCWDHLIVAPLWVAYKANLGTLLVVFGANKPDRNVKFDLSRKCRQDYRVDLASQ